MRNIAEYCGILLLILVTLYINPIIDNNLAHAKDDEYASIQVEVVDASIALVITNSEDKEAGENDIVSTNTKLNDISYINTDLSITANKIRQFYAIYKKPLYFVHGGSIASGKLSEAGIYGRYWSSLIISSGQYGFSARNLDFGYSVNHSSSSDSSGSFSVRCMVR